MWADHVVDEYARETQGIDCFLAGSPMCFFCHVVDKRYNAVVAISWDQQVSYEVHANSLPTAFGYWKCL